VEREKVGHVEAVALRGCAMVEYVGPHRVRALPGFDVPEADDAKDERHHLLRR
jgi:hypothetical protein